MKLPEQELAVLAQDPIDPQLTVALAQASFAAYSDYEGIPYDPPTNYRKVAGWTGWDELIDGYGYEEKYGLLFASTLLGARTYIFAFRGTDSDMDVYEDLFVNTVSFVPYSGQILNPPDVASGFFSVYTGIGGTMTQSMQQQVFALLGRIPSGSKIYISGHSLGGALSQLFTYDVSISTPNVWVANMNFASPKVGLQNWQSAYDSQPAQQDPARKSVRVYNYWDYIPSAPPYVWPFPEYFHVGREFRTSFFVKDEWYVHEGPRHSLANLQIVLGNAVWMNPQVWTGTFTDQTDPPRLMLSTAPPAGADVEWSARAHEQVQFEQSILEGKAG